jgi:hypothetical protein
MGALASEAVAARGSTAVPVSYPVRPPPRTTELRVAAPWPTSPTRVQCSRRGVRMRSSKCATVSPAAFCGPDSGHGIAPIHGSRAIGAVEVERVRRKREAGPWPRLTELAACRARLFATGSDDHTARLWTLPDGRELLRVSHNDMVYGLAFSPDGERLATGSLDHTARVWALPDGSELLRVSHEDRAEGVAFSPNGEQLATASNDHTARVWAL